MNIWLIFILIWCTVGFISSFSLSIFVEKQLTIGGVFFNLTLGALLGLVPTVVLIQSVAEMKSLDKKWKKFLNKRITQSNIKIVKVSLILLTRIPPLIRLYISNYFFKIFII